MITLKFSLNLQGYLIIIQLIFQLAVEDYVNIMDLLTNDVRFSTYNVCYKRVLVVWILTAFLILLGLLFSGLTGLTLFGLGVLWLVFNAAAIFLCMWIKIKVSALDLNMILKMSIIIFQNGIIYLKITQHFLYFILMFGQLFFIILIIFQFKLSKNLKFGYKNVYTLQNLTIHTRVLIVFLQVQDSVIVLMVRNENYIIEILIYATNVNFISFKRQVLLSQRILPSVLYLVQFYEGTLNIKSFFCRVTDRMNGYFLAKLCRTSPCYRLPLCLKFLRLCLLINASVFILGSVHCKVCFLGRF